MPTLYGDLFPRNMWLSGFSQEWLQKQERLKALNLAPMVEAPGLQFSYPVVSASEMNRIPLTDRAPYGPIRKGKLDMSLTDVTLQQEAFGVELDRTVIPRAPGALPQLYAQSKERATKKSARVVFLRHELNTRNYLTDLANYPTSNKDTLVGPAQWSNPATSNPIEDAQVALAAIKVQAEGDYTQMSAPLPVWQALARHPQITEQVKYTEGSSLQNLMAQQIARLLGFDRGVVLEASYDLSVEGEAAANITWLWGNDVLFQVLSNNPGEETASHAVTFSLYPELVMSDEWLEGESPLVDLYWSHIVVKVLIVNQYAGYLLKAATA